MDPFKKRDNSVPPLKRRHIQRENVGVEQTKGGKQYHRKKRGILNRSCQLIAVTGLNPVLPTRPVSRTGVIPEEPVVTQVVAAGSGVLCGSVLPDADAF